MRLFFVAGNFYDEGEAQPPGDAPMPAFRKILVGVDVSGAEQPTAEALPEPTREAVGRAIWLGEQLSAEVTFLAAEDLGALERELVEEKFDVDRETVSAAIRSVLDELVANAEQQGVQASALVAAGNAWEAIIREVLRNDHDLVIVGTRNRGAVSRMLFGSTGAKLLRNCPCPVWITRPDPDWSDLNILVASDLSEVSQRAVNLGVDAARISGANLHIVNSVDTLHGRRMWLTGMTKEKLHEYREFKFREAENAVHEQLAQTDYRTLAIDVQVHIDEGAPDVAILNAIDQYNIDLLIMGTVARGGIPGLLIGNTAERLLAQVPCSVLAVKPDGFECPVKLHD